MSEANRETLSAGMDGELSREEIRFLLRRLEADQGLADAWSRYHVARDGLRGQLAPPVSGDFASRVMAAIDAESAIVAPVAAPRRRWLHWSAGGAIAASVAVAALMLSQPAGNSRSIGGEAQVAQGAAVTSGTQVAEASIQEPASAPVAPQWLSGGNMASQFTQKAAYEGPGGDEGAVYLPRSTPYQIHRTRAAQAQDNGYMLLVRPDGSRYVAPVTASQAH